MKIFFPKFSRKDVIREVSRCVTELHDSLGLEGVILFGSYAKGRYTVASDLDLLIFDDEKSSEDNVYKSLMKSIKLPRVELRIISKREIESYRGSMWIKTIEREGNKDSVDGQRRLLPLLPISLLASRSHMRAICKIVSTHQKF